MESRAVSSVLRARGHFHQLLSTYPWTKAPLIVGAPMRVMSGPQLAVAVSSAGGLGFIGPGTSPATSAQDLDTARELLSSLPSGLPCAPGQLPIGVGFQVWNGNLEVAAAAVEAHCPCAVWLFAPKDGQSELDAWTRRLRQASPSAQIWLQVGTLREAVDACKSSAAPDVLVLQGAEAGGHGRAADGVGLISLLAEVADATSDSGIALVAAGGVADGRGVASALSLGASAVAMGTRFLASSEARIAKGYQQDVLRIEDGAASTVRTHLYNHLRGTFGWPEQFSPRAVKNRSWDDLQQGVPFEELQRRHDEAASRGDAAWGPEGRVAAYVGASVGLVRTVQDAGEIVQRVRDEAKSILQILSSAD